MRHGWPFRLPPEPPRPKAGDLGFRRPAAGSLSSPVCRVVGVNRTPGSGRRAHRRSDVLLGELPGAAGLSRARKPLAVPVAVVVGQPGVEVALCRRTGGHCAQADKRPNPRTYEGIFRPRVCTLNCNRLKGQFCPGRLAPSCRRSVPRRQSPSARHEPGCGRRRSYERPTGGAAGHEVAVRGSARRSLWPTGSVSQSTKGHETLRLASSPSACVRF